MQVFTPTALMNADMSSFMHKWLTDLCEDSQFADGSYSDHAPFYGRIYTVNVGWGDAGVICPYLCYKTYGDIEFISAHYDSMKRFAAYLTRYANIDHTWRSLSDGNGDHLAKGGGVSKEVMGSIYFAYILGLMAQIAEALGRPDDAAYYLGEYTLAKKAFIREYILPDGKIRDSSLTGFALAITMDLVPDTMMSAVSAAFAEEIARLGYQPATGFIGTSRLLTALNRIGRDDLADKLLFNRKCPSWLYPVTKGATTIWERWDGWTDEKGFADRGMNSFNHFAFGSAGEYLYHCVLGIQQAPESVAYQDIVIKPSILQSLNFAAGSYESVRGKISSSWKIENNICTLEVEIPEGPDAKVILSAEGKVEAPCPEETGRDACRVFKVKPGHSVFRFTPHPGLVKGNL
jgi:alpha-L-rhamnosidase